MAWGGKGAEAGREAGGAIAGLNAAEPSELGGLRAAEACGLRGVAVKCIDIAQSPDCEGSVPCRH